MNEAILTEQVMFPLLQIQLYVTEQACTVELVSTLKMNRLWLQEVMEPKLGWNEDLPISDHTLAS